MIYDQLENELFSSKTEVVPFNASLAIKGEIRGTSKEKLSHELSFKSPRRRGWLKRIDCLYILTTAQKLLYLFNLIRPKLHSLGLLNIYLVTRYKSYYFKNSFISYVVREWNKLSTEICNSTSYQ